jgi:hypothetical protein
MKTERTFVVGSRYCKTGVCLYASIATFFFLIAVFMNSESNALYCVTIFHIAKGSSASGYRTLREGQCDFSMPALKCDERKWELHFSISLISLKFSC